MLDSLNLNSFTKLCFLLSLRYVFFFLITCKFTAPKEIKKTSLKLALIGNAFSI